MKHRSLIEALICLAIACLVVLALPSYNWQQRMVGGIFILTVGFWICGILPLGVTALGSMALLTFMAGITEIQAFSGLGDPVTPILISSLFLAKAIEVSGLGRRLARRFINLPWARGRPALLILNLLLGSTLLAVVLPLPTITAMMIPICLSIFNVLDEEVKKTGFASCLLLAVAFGPWISLLTPINNVLDIIAIGDLKSIVHSQISIGTWIMFGLPITMALVLIVWLALWFLLCRGVNKLNFAIGDQEESTDYSDSEKKTLFVIVIAFFFLFFPSLIGLIVGSSGSQLGDLVSSRFSMAVVMSLSALLLFVLPVKGNESGKTLTWKEATEINWGLVLFVAGSISLGNAITETGLAKEIGKSIAYYFNPSEMWEVTGISIFVGTFLSEFINGVTAATSVIPIIINAAQVAGIHPYAPVIGTLFGINIGFAFPFSNVSNALVHATGLVPQKRMFIAGGVIGLVGMIVVFILLRLLLPVLGLS